MRDATKDVMQVSNVQALEATTRAKLRSTQILTSLPQVVSELLQNSLDAESRRIEVGLDCDGWSCWVRDDGSGINREGLDALINGEEQEERRYATSKAYEPDSLNGLSTFGFRGEALSSAADLCCLEISSRTSRSRQSWSVILKGGKVLYNGPSIRWRRESRGTVVSIQDAFYNLPVRRQSHPSPAKTLEMIRADIEAYALVFPHVSFSLESKSSSRRSCGEYVLRVPKTESILAAFRHLYGKALAQHVEEIDATSGEMRIEGFVSLSGAHSKSYQFMYINRHPVSYGDLQRVIDMRFSASTFAKHSYDENGETTARSSIRRSPRKKERKPVYVLNLTVPSRYVDNCLGPDKSVVQFQNRDAVCSFLSSIIQSFLVNHGFAHKTPERSRTKSDESPSPGKRRRIRQSDDQERSASLGAFPVNGDYTGKGKERDLASGLYVRMDEDDNSEPLTWTDPHSLHRFLVDPRTGNSYLRSEHTDGDHGLRPPQQRRTLSDPRWFQQKENHAVEDTEAMPHWIKQALQANKAYGLTETRIPTLGMPSTFVQGQSSRRAHFCLDHDADGSSHRSGWTNTLESAAWERRFTKAGLFEAEILDQVDRKFIACLMKDQDELSESPRRALVLIDQHAADERVRVERFLRELCLGFLHQKDNAASAVKVKELSPPVPVLLTRHEASRLVGPGDIRRAFECWGVRFVDLPQGLAGGENVVSIEGDYVQVMVSTVPEIVSDKLLMGSELQELVKGFLATLDTDSLSFGGRHTDDTSDDNWLRALRWCPRELLDLVNSKACRGAIMFNDSLTLEQCQRLVRQLSETAFPFQCAHGRPSLVPLARVESLGGSSCGRRSEVDWAKFEA